MKLTFAIFPILVPPFPRYSFDGVFRIVREEGGAALFRGVGPNVARAVLMNASQLAT